MRFLSAVVVAFQILPGLDRATGQALGYKTGQPGKLLVIARFELVHKPVVKKLCVKIRIDSR